MVCPLTRGPLRRGLPGSVDGRDHAAVDVDGLGGDPAGLGSGEETHDGYDVGRVAEFATDGLSGEPGESLVVLGAVEEARLLRAGAMLLTVMPRWPISLAKALVKCSTGLLLPEYAE
jgi:hypothetical protein